MTDSNRSTDKPRAEDGPQVRYLMVEPDQAGQRLDNFLSGALKGVPRSRLYRIVRKGEVRVNRGRARPDYKLRAGDRVRIPPVRRSRESADAPPRDLVERLESAIVAENEKVMVLDKPAGLAVHGGTGIAHGVIEALRAARGSAVQLVHRLDRGTSGCLLVAKNREAAARLGEALRSGACEKRYLALLVGHLSGDRRVRAPLVYGRHRGERRGWVEEGGKEAVTRLEVRERYGSGEAAATLAEALPETGRMHQIRLHAAHLGHPVAGDQRYGDQGFNSLLQQRFGLRRIFLHAHALTVPSGGGQASTYQVPLPPELRDVLDHMTEVA